MISDGATVKDTDRLVPQPGFSTTMLNPDLSDKTWVGFQLYHSLAYGQVSKSLLPVLSSRLFKRAHFM